MSLSRQELDARKVVKKLAAAKRAVIRDDLFNQFLQHHVKIIRGQV